MPVNINEKNPVALLNELRPGLEYTLIERVGPVHAPLFTMSVKIDEQEFQGKGTTKKKAKAKAAENALRSFIQLPNSSEVSCPIIKNNIDFTADVSADNTGSAHRNVHTTLPAKIKAVDLTKGPVMLLNEMYSGLKYECQQVKGDVFGSFKTTVEVCGDVFVGTGTLQFTCFFISSYIRSSELDKAQNFIH